MGRWIDRYVDREGGREGRGKGPIQTCAAMTVVMDSSHRRHCDSDTPTRLPPKRMCAPAEIERGEERRKRNRDKGMEKEGQRQRD